MNLTICQECHENPAVYGDGLTWSRCGSCQLKYEKKSDISKEPASPEQSFTLKIKQNFVSVILPVYMVNYTLFHYTGNCIGALREHTVKDLFELIVVDNGSPVQPPELQSYYAHKVIKNEKNLGVTRAWNQGITISQGEYIVLLNNDVQVFNGWLEGLKVELDSGYDFVMAHPMYSLTEPFARASEAAAVLAGTKKFDSLEKDFSCVMFRRSLVEELGGFDEAFFNYCSDSDFFRRMEEAGKKWKMVDQVATSHISDATGYSLSETPEVMNQDKKTFAQKWDNVKKVVGNLSSDPLENLLVRSDRTGDAIFLLKNNQRHHITSPEVLHALGFEFGQEMVVSEIKLELGEDITMKNVGSYA